MNWPGTVPRHTGAAEWIDRAIALVAPHARRVCVRGDTDFSLTVNFDRWSKEEDFIFGYDAQPTIVKRAEELRVEASGAQAPLHVGKTRSKRANEKGRIVRERGYVNYRLDFGDVAEYEYRPTKCRQTYRIVVVRKNISKSNPHISPES